MIINHPEITVVGLQPELQIFFGVTNLGTPVWGRLDATGSATEIHPLYVRSNHTNILTKIAEAVNSGI